MANRNWNSGRRSGDFGRGYDRPFTNRPNPWQGDAAIGGSPMSLGNSDATFSIASNLIANLLQQRQNNVPSLLDMPPVHRDFGNFDRGYGDRRPPSGRMSGRVGQGSNFNRRNNAPARRSGTQNFQQGNKNKPSKKPNESNKSDSKADEDDKTEDSEKPKTNGEAPKDGDYSAYDGILPEFLQCHVCDKKMWDGRSFQNHIKGRAHKLMMEKNLESYMLTADAMRQELKMSEMKRGRPEKRDYYCAMCDLYTGDAAKHRLSLGHRRLKRYLHPSCNCCRKENSNRIELDEHRLTPQHMRTMQDKSKDFVVKPQTDALLVHTKEHELLHVRYPKRRYGKDRDNLKTKQDLELAALSDKRKKEWEARVKERKEKKEKKETNETEKTEKTEGEEAKVDGVKKEVGEEEEAQVKVETEGEEGATAEAEVKMEEAEVDAIIIDPKNYIMDFKEDQDLSAVTENDLPIYDIELSYGQSFIGDYACKRCTLCNKLLDTNETAEVHLKTWRHYKLFAETLRVKAGLIVKKEPVAKRTLSESCDGEVNQKRRKVDEDGNPVDEEGEDHGNVDVKMEGDNETTTKQNDEAMDQDKPLDETSAAVQEDAVAVKPAAAASQELDSSQETDSSQPQIEDSQEKADAETEAALGQTKKGGRPRGRGGRRGR